MVIKTNKLVSDNAIENGDTMVKEFLISKTAFLDGEICAKFVEAYFIITELEGLDESGFEMVEFTMRVGSGKVSELVSFGQRPSGGSMRRRATTHGPHTEYDHVYTEGQRGTFQPLAQPRGGPSSL